MALAEYDFPRTTTDFLLEEEKYDLLQDYCRALAIAQLKKNSFVLDIGTGSGRMATVLHAEGYPVISIDSNPDTIERTQGRLDSMVAKSTLFAIQDATHTSFSGESFESIVCANALHEISAPFAALAEMWRICSTSGKLVIIEFNENGYEVIGRIHQQVYGTSHTEGVIRTHEINKWLADHFSHMEHCKLPLNNIWIASKKQQMEKHPVYCHNECFACGPSNCHGLHLEFAKQGDGCVIATHVIDACYQGYPGITQGGIVATLLDSAMTNCLFHNGIKAMTAQLNIRYHEPVETGQAIVVEARLQKKRGRLCELSASIMQDDILKATATAKFMKVAQQTKE